jgi:hypothetical protein
MRRSTARRWMRIRPPIRNTGRGKVPAFSARYNVDWVSPSSIAVSSTLSSGRGDLGKDLSRMDHRSCSVPGRVPWSQPLLRMNVTPNVILDKGHSSILRVTLETTRFRTSPWPMPVQAAVDGKKRTNVDGMGVTLTRCFSWAGVTLRVGESARGRTEIAGFSRCVLITREHGG